MSSMFPFNDPKTVAGKYGPFFKKSKKQDILPVIKLPPKTIGGLRDQMAKTKQCNCRRSYCLKLYCDCFQAGVFCQTYCNCLGCKNNEFGGAQRTQAILVTLDRNPHAFRPRLLSLGVGEMGDDKTKRSGVNGCNCRKSFCLKKYCECFQAAVTCSATLCRCLDCQNTEGNKKREELMQKRKKAQDSAAAQAKAAQQHTRLALEGDETVVGIGVDAFLPPSTYTIPVKFQSGVPFAALAFGCCDNDQATKPVSAVLQEKSTPSEQTGYGGETELETAWQNEARDLQLLSSAVTKELKRRHGDTVVEYPLHNDQIKQRAIDIIGTAEVGVKRLRAAVEIAEAAAKQQHLDTDQGSVEEMVDDNEDEGGSVYNDDPLACNETLNETGNPLICSEILPPQKKTKISDKAARELTVLAYQDEALLKELTAIVKERTLELAKIRKKRNEELV